MNKRDLKNMARETVEVEPNKVPVFSREDFKAAVEAVAKELGARQGVKDASRSSRDGYWREMFVAAVSGQMGWLNAAVADAGRLETRLGILAEIAEQSVAFAVKRGKIK